MTQETPRKYIFPNSLFSGERVLMMGMFRPLITDTDLGATIQQDTFEQVVRAPYGEAGQSYSITVINPALLETQTGLSLVYLFNDMQQLLPDPELITKGRSSWSPASIVKSKRNRLTFSRPPGIPAEELKQVANLVGTKRTGGDHFLISLLNPHPDITWEASDGINIQDTTELITALNLNVTDIGKNLLQLGSDS